MHHVSASARVRSSPDRFGLYAGVEIVAAGAIRGQKHPQMNYLADAVQHGAHIFTHVSVQTVEQCTEGGS